MAEVEDIIYQMTGAFGKWQLRMILLFFLCKIPSSWFMAVIIYSGPALKMGEFYCKPPEELSFNKVSDWIMLVHPLTQITDLHHNTINTFDSCHVYKDVMDNPKFYMNLLNSNRSVSEDTRGYLNRTTVKCYEFVYLTEYDSIITTFDLVCNRKILVPVTQTFHILGVLIGGIIATWLMAKYSPLTIMLWGMFTQVVFGMLTGVMVYYELHVFFRCLTAVSCVLMYATGLNIMTVITFGKARIITITLFELFWSIGLILLPGMAIFFNSWSHLYVAISCPTLMLIFLHRYMPDSPVWYLERGKIREAKTILLEASRINKLIVPPDLENKLMKYARDLKEAPPHLGWMTLWEGNPRKHIMLAVHYSWAIFIIIFNSMVLNIRAFGREHLHINTAIIGLSEIIGTFFGLYLILYARKRWLWAGLFSISTGIVVFFTWLIPDTIRENRRVGIEMIASILLKTSTSCALSVLTTCTTQLVVPEKRKILMFSVNVWGRTWFLAAPFVNYLKEFGRVVPLSAFATLSVIGGVLVAVINKTIFRINSQEQLNKTQSTDSITISTISIGTTSPTDLNKEPRFSNIIWVNKESDNTDIIY